MGAKGPAGFLQRDFQTKALAVECRKDARSGGKYTNDLVYSRLAPAYELLGMMRASESWEKFLRIADKTFPRVNITLACILGTNRDFLAACTFRAATNMNQRSVRTLPKPASRQTSSHFPSHFMSQVHPNAPK